MKDLIGSVTRTLRRPSNAAPVPYSSRYERSSWWLNGRTDCDADRIYEAFGSVGTLFAIVTQLTNAFVSVKWHLYRRTSQRDELRRNEILLHPFLKKWERPNDFFTGRGLREAAQQHLDLIGEAFIVLNKLGSLVTDMWVVRPDRMQPVKDPDKYLLGWVYTGPGSEVIPLELDQVIQLKYPNPADPYRGMGPVQTCLFDLDAARYSAQWNMNFFINGAAPGGIIEFPYAMNDQQWKRFVNRWRDQHQGVANAHRVAVLEVGTWKDTKFSMEDMQFVELRNLPRELIREAFAFPKPLLGTVDDVNRANSQAGKEILAENHTTPRLDRWSDVVNTWLLPMFSNGSMLALDYENPVPRSRDDDNKERNSKAAAASTLVRAGYDPDDVLEVVGLPKMRFKGTPGAATTESLATNGQEPVGEPPVATSKIRTLAYHGWHGTREFPQTCNACRNHRPLIAIGG